MSDYNQDILGELKETFKMFDVDGDGCITVEVIFLVIKSGTKNSHEKTWVQYYRRGFVQDG